MWRRHQQADPHCTPSGAGRGGQERGGRVLILAAWSRPQGSVEESLFRDVTTVCPASWTRARTETSLQTVPRPRLPDHKHVHSDIISTPVPPAACGFLE